ncbi:MAG: ribonuclease HI family protein [Candidatus Levybacteria bacterium]|nr:ribonuclease HI family protein [Candidatus Levybacteria bacterium]
MLKVYTDGGARGNPGPAAIGVYITDEHGNKVYAFGKKIGIATNNVAEYKAVIEALCWLVLQSSLIKAHKTIVFFLDSQLIYSQIVGAFKVKNEVLQSLIFTVQKKMQQISATISFVHIPREANIEADRYVNIALDTN